MHLLHCDATDNARSPPPLTHFIFKLMCLSYRCLPFGGEKIAGKMIVEDKFYELSKEISTFELAMCPSLSLSAKSSLELLIALN